MIAALNKLYISLDFRCLIREGVLGVGMETEVLERDREREREGERETGRQSRQTERTGRDRDIEADGVRERGEGKWEMRESVCGERETE